MPKTIKGYILNSINLLRARLRGVRVYNNTVLSKVKFNGAATVEPYCRLSGDPLITVGENFYLNSGSHLLGEIVIGNDVMIGPKTIIWGRDHGMELGVPMRLQSHTKKKIVIGDDVWIGAGVIILKGVSIGEGAVVGAGSIVTKNIPSYSIAVGNPAKVVKKRTLEFRGED